MTSFVGNASGGTAGIDVFRADDVRLWPEWADDDTFRWITNDAIWAMEGYASPWWPRSTLDSAGDEWIQARWWDRPEITSGAVARVVFTGVTRDVYGAILPAATVKLFKTADASYPGSKDAKIDEVVSDATSGAFTLGSPYYPDTHYLVAYKAGVPDVEGTSVNTLIGT